ncbi:MAG: hypothetical protein AB7N76_29800 [Planctomycetota bacterium]
MTDPNTQEPVPAPGASAQAAPGPQAAPTPAAPTPQAAPTPPPPASASVGDQGPGRLQAHRRYRWGRKPREAAQASPAYMIAGFLHLALLVALSFWTIAVYVQREARPVEVKLATPQKVIPVTAGVDRSEQAALDALADATQRDLDAVSEEDTNDPFQEARGDSSGQVNVFGAGAGGRSGVGRGGRKHKRAGSSKASDGALSTGLEWLARHRTADGAWGPINGNHQDPDGQKESPFGSPDDAHTGAALLAFLCAGHHPGEEGPYRAVVDGAETWLLGRVRRDGRLPSNCAYSHALATLALSECLAHRRQAHLPSEAVEVAVQRLVRVLIHERSRTKGGWRYFGNHDADMSVTSWVVLALRAARAAEVEVPESAFKGAQSFLERVTAADGDTGYTTRGGGSPAMQASGLFLRVMLGEAPTTKRNAMAARVVAQTQISFDGAGVQNFYELYYAALAMYQVGGELWEGFNQRIRDGLVSVQRKGKHCERGSWQGGGYISDLVLATSFASLILETYYRYLPVHGGVGALARAEDAPPELSEGERLLDQALVAMRYAREGKGGGELLAAEAACLRALRRLEREKDTVALQSEARLRLVELASLGGERAQVLARIADYLRGLPSGQRPDPTVLRLRRLEAVAEVHRRGEAALTGKDPAAGREVEQAALALVQNVEPELAELKPWSEERAEGEQLVSRLRELATRLAFSDDPARAIAAASARVAKSPPTGPLGREERQLLSALLLHANERFAAAAKQRDPVALAGGEQAMLQLEQRRMGARLDKDELARVQPLIEQAGLRRVLALLALGRHARAAEEARSFQRAHPESGLGPQAEAVERGALSVLVSGGRAADEDRARLKVLLVRYAGRNPELKPDERLALAQLLEDSGAAEAAAGQYRALLGQGDQAQQTHANLRLARLARLEGQVERCLTILERIPIQERLDVILERCLAWRARRAPDQALKQYLELLRTLTGKEHAPHWWQIAYEAGQAYLEAGEVEGARRFLEDLRVKDRSFGGDEQLRSRFLALMRRADLAAR